MSAIGDLRRFPCVFVANKNEIYVVKERRALHRAIVNLLFKNMARKIKSVNSFPSLSFAVCPS